MHEIGIFRAISNFLWRLDNETLGRTFSKQYFYNQRRISGYGKSLILVSCSGKLRKCQNVLVFKQYKTAVIALLKTFCFVAVPGQPSLVQCGQSDNISLNINWSKPSNPNGFIRSYNVSWNKIKNINGASDQKGKKNEKTTNLTSIDIEGLGKFYVKG
jgi:hypothetical protein